MLFISKFGFTKLTLMVSEPIETSPSSFFYIDYLFLPLLPDQIVSISALQNVTPSKKNKYWSSSQKMVSFSMLIFSKNSIIQSIFPDYDYTLLIISRHTPAKPVPRELNLMARRAKSLTSSLPPSLPLPTYSDILIREAVDCVEEEDVEDPEEDEAGERSGES